MLFFSTNRRGRKRREEVNKVLKDRFRKDIFTEIINLQKG